MTDEDDSAECGGDWDQDELESAEKVEGITLEYTFLLTSQLDSQRRYYEDKLQEAECSAVERIHYLEQVWFSGCYCETSDGK